MNLRVTAVFCEFFIDILFRCSVKFHHGIEQLSYPTPCYCLSKSEKSLGDAVAIVGKCAKPNVFFTECYEVEPMNQCAKPNTIAKHLLQYKRQWKPMIR